MKLLFVGRDSINSMRQTYTAHVKWAEILSGVFRGISEKCREIVVLISPHIKSQAARWNLYKVFMMQNTDKQKVKNLLDKNIELLHGTLLVKRLFSILSSTFAFLFELFQNKTFFC